ncbi:hypothetical protein HPP92_020389 [Vanilla planifolia]|uniref:Uncharacterized protein n=1 Tax=Vanilla planifolia TaxID=51239 RepID=A0A835Q3K5_VANPL|nr:hypothetical protein HPP92_020389 [Vanilla planifolia]
MSESHWRAKCSRARSQDVKKRNKLMYSVLHMHAGIAQLGERQTEDLKVACSIHAHRN